MGKISNFINKNDTNLVIGAGMASGFIFGSAVWYKTGQKVQNIINSKKKELKRNLTLKEKIKFTWKVFIFPTVNTVASAVAIAYATKVNNRRLAALGAAYNLTEMAFQNYMDKTKEIIGKKKEEEIKQATAEESFKKEDKNIVQVITTGKDDILVHEPLTDRYFRSSWSKIKNAELDLNLDAANSYNGRISLTQWFYKLGLDKTDISDDLGWDVQKHGKYGAIDVEPGSCLGPDNEPGIEIHYNVRPEYFE